MYQWLGVQCIWEWNQKSGCVDCLFSFFKRKVPVFELETNIPENSHQPNPTCHHFHWGPDIIIAILLWADLPPKPLWLRWTTAPGYKHGMGENVVSGPLGAAHEGDCSERTKAEERGLEVWWRPVFRRWLRILQPVSIVIGTTDALLNQDVQCLAHFH